MEASGDKRLMTRDEIEELSAFENIVMDDIIYSNWEPKPYKTKWTPQSLASFMSHWFAQDKLRKMNNNIKID